MADSTSRGAEQPAIRRELRVWATVGEAYAIWAHNIGLWLRLSIVPVALLVVFWAAAALVLPNPLKVEADAFPTLQYALLIFCMVLMSLAEIPRMTAWHRFVLTPDDVASHRYLIGNREWRYFLRALLFTVILYLLLLVVFTALSLIMVPEMLQGTKVDPESLVAFDLTSTVASLGVCALVVFVFANLIFRLSAAAIGSNLTRRQARTAIASNRGRLTAAIAIGIFPILLAAYLLSRLFGAQGFGEQGDALFIPSDLVIYLPTLVFGPVISGVLSIIYRDLLRVPEVAAA